MNEVFEMIHLTFLSQKKTAALLLACMLGFSSAGCGRQDSAANGQDSAAASHAQGSLSHEGYTLEQVVVLSRHNIRSPLSGGDSLLGQVTPHTWHTWSSAPSELSLRGGVLETEMGQYFRVWMEQEGLFPANYQPDADAVRIYSNSKQRTIATARYFSAGLLPAANTEVEYHMEYDKMDPVFTPQLTFLTDDYEQDVREQIHELFAEKIAGLEDNYKLLADVIDLEQSPAYKDGSVSALRTDDSEFILKENAEPGVSGSLKTACQISDALVLQYYEEPDEKKAAFDHSLSSKDWETISEIKDLYGDVLFTAPLVAPNVAHPLLEEIRSELDNKDRVFTFLCGHDSNVGSVLAALQAEDYEAPDAIEKKTPIGCKLVFAEWRGPDGKAYISVDLVYQTAEQLRSAAMLGQDVSPAVFSISLAGLQKNADGLYQADAVMERLDASIGKYDSLIATYGYKKAA